MPKKFELFVYLVKHIIRKIRNLNKLYFILPIYSFILLTANKVKHTIMVFFKTPLTLTPELAKELVIKTKIITEFLKILPKNIDIKTLNLLFRIVYRMLTDNDNK